MRDTRYKIIDLVQGSQEWLDFRKGKIGASMAPVIMGVSPFQTRLQLWEEIIFDTEKPKTEAMERGRRLESKALAWFNNKMGREYKPAVLQSIAHPEMIASLDGYFENDEGKPHLLEIKCPGSEAHLLALEGKIPDYYYPQLQHQMDLAGVNQMLYMSFDGEEGKIIPCFRDEHYCVDLFASELAFFAHIIDFRPPEPSDMDEVVINDPELIMEAFKYKDLSSSIEKLQAELTESKTKILASMKNSRSRIGDLKVQKVIRKGTIDYSKIEELKKVDLEAYRKEPVISWRFTQA